MFEFKARKLNTRFVCELSKQSEFARERNYDDCTRFERNSNNKPSTHIELWAQVECADL